MSDEVYTNIQYITQREKLTCSAKNNHIRQRENDLGSNASLGPARKKIKCEIV